jgi:hypothetical protein
VSTKGTTRLLAEHLGAAFGEIANSFANASAAQLTLRRLRWQFNPVPKPYLDLATAAADVVAKVKSSQQSGADDAALIDSILKLVSALYNSFKVLPAPPNIDADAFKAEIPEQLVSLFVGDYLAAKVPALYHALVQFGIVQVSYQPEETAADGTLLRPAAVERTFKYSEIPALISDPAGLPARAFGWGTPTFRFDRVAAPLAELLTAAGLLAFVEGVNPDLVDRFQDQPSPGKNITTFVRVSFLETLIADAPVNVAVALLDAPIEAGHPLPGIVVQPLIPTLNQQIPIGANTNITVTGGIDTQNTFGLFIRPKEDPELRFPFVAGSGVPAAGIGAEIAFAPPSPSILLGQANQTRLEASGAKLGISVLEKDAKIEVKAEASSSFRVIVKPSDGDGFIAKLLEGVAGNGLTAPIDVGIRWSNRSGFGLTAAGGFELRFNPNLTLGPVVVQTLVVALRAGADGGVPALRASVGAGVAATLGPVSAVVDDVGVNLNFQFVEGNAGRFNFTAGFKPPSGVGISVNAGAISGGGFLSFDFDAGRYSGAIELEAYSISIKAFGLIETKVPGGGFSFVIVISTEFATPIQLGLGFTLNGVGGLIGINRTVNSDALRALVVAGRTENLLFPKNVIANAPAIIRDLGTVFPARSGHYVFGPLAKLGWGTPTLITAELALILELPGPVLSLIGEVKCLLPKPELALVKFNMSIAGQLDFPHKTFSLDAALHDSIIDGYPVSGQMAMRLRWGEQPNFALSIGGFHPAYQPPPNFPKLQPMTVALAQQGSTSVTVSGFFALTSNTLQIGGEARLHAGGSGISLDASIAVKTIFIFSPFSFAANIDASVKISFHGHGPSVHLSGVLSGPSPWRAKGEVCVSILWWDACLRFDQTFGGATTVPEPVIDPWLGSATIQGLKPALEDPKNWAALPPPGAFAVVSRAPGANDLVDPLGGFTVRQKVLPVETTLPIARFGPAKAAEPPANRTGPIFFNNGAGAIVRPAPAGNLPLTKVDTLKDFFPPAQFFDLNEAKKLSAKSFDKYGSGYSFGIGSRNLEPGSSAPKTVTYTTVILGSGNTPTQTNPGDYDLPDTHLAAKSATSAVARGGFGQSGTRRYIDPTATQPFDVNDTGFALAHADTLKPLNPGDAPLPRADALVALDNYLAQHPDKRGQIQVVTTFELAA